MNFYALGWKIGSVLSQPSGFFPIDFGTKTRKNCSKGYNCGGSCISTKKKCRVAVAGEAKTFAEHVKQNKKHLAKVQKTATKQHQKTAAKQQSIKTKDKINPPKQNTVSDNKKEIPFNHVDFIQKGQKLLSDKDKAILNKHTQQIKPLLEKRDNLEKEAAESLKKTGSVDQSFYLRAEEIRSEIEDIPNRNKAKAVMDKLKKQLESVQSVSDQKINEAIERLNISAKALEQNPEIKSQLKEYISLTGFTLDNVKTLDYVTDRAYAQKDTGTVNIGKGGKNRIKNKAALFHEISHFYEYQNDSARSAANEWIRDKAKEYTGSSNIQPKKLKDITGSPNYQDDELAYEDTFLAPYVGKTYEHKGRDSTEVISMGVEHFISPLKMLELYAQDDSHFHLITGLLSSKQK